MSNPYAPEGQDSWNKGNDQGAFPGTALCYGQPEEEKGSKLPIIVAGIAGVVEKVIIRGPVAPSWRKGPYVVRGRGPRADYG